MNRVLRVLCVAIIVSVVNDLSLALPRFALMMGAKCGSCHVNPTGGQMRNEYGITFSTDKVPLEALRDSEFIFSSKLNDNISIGGDYRGQFFYDDASKTTTFQSMTGSLYGSIRLSRKATFFFKQDIVNGTYGGWFGGTYGGTEAFGIIRPFSGSSYLKGGIFLPDYGWRLDDHTAYTRGGDLGFFQGSGSHPGLIFVPNYKDIGIEVGGYVESFSVTAGLFNGTGHMAPLDPSKDKAYVGKVEYVGLLSSVNVRLGVSGYGFMSYKMGGVNLGLATGDVVFLGEVDWTHNRLNPLFDPYSSIGSPVTESVKSMASYAEADFRMVQGLWLVGKFDMFDPQQGISDDELKRATLGFELFPYSFVEFRPEYRLILGSAGASDNSQFLIQSHFWF